MAVSIYIARHSKQLVYISNRNRDDNIHTKFNSIQSNPTIQIFKYRTNCSNYQLLLFLFLKTNSNY